MIVPMKIKKVTNVPVAPFEPDTIYLQAISGNTATYKAVRWVGTSLQSGDHVVVGELSGSATQPGTIISIGDQPGNPPANAFDGDINVVWASPSGQKTDQWIGKIFTTPVFVSTLTIVSGTNTDNPPGDNFKIQVSDDTTDGTDGVWVDLYSETGYTWGASETRSFTLAGTRSTLAIHVSNHAGNAIVSNVTPAQVSASAISLTESHIKRVADIATRDTETYTQDVFVIVTDAVADPDVVAGGALYLYNQAADAYTLITVFDPLGWPVSTSAW